MASKITTRLPGVVCERTICVSDAVRNRLVNDYGFPAEKTITIRNGVDLKHYGGNGCKPGVIRETLNILPSDDVLVCLSRFVPQKRIDVLIKAMAIVSKQHPSCKCLIVGEGALERELRSLSSELGLSSSVIFAGHKQDVRPYLEAGDIFVLPSQKEGLPLSVLEAMAHGLPCVVTDAGGNKEAVLHGHNGIVVSPGSVDELAKAIQYLLSHSDERKRMGESSRMRVENCFNIEASMARIKAIIFSDAQVPTVRDNSYATDNTLFHR